MFKIGDYVTPKPELLYKKYYFIILKIIDIDSVMGIIGRGILLLHEENSVKIGNFITRDFSDFSDFIKIEWE